MSTIEVNKIAPVSGGTAVTMGDSGDTFTVPTGAGLTVTDEVKTNKISPASGTTFTLGDSGDTFNIPSGATIANAGTATGFTPSLIPDNLQVFAKSANQTISANSATNITGYGTGQISDRLLFNYGTQYVTHSSGIFSFSTEGFYHVVLRITGSQTASGGTATGHVYLNSTTNNSSYADAIDINLTAQTATGGFNSYYDGVFKITDTTNHKLSSQIYLPQGGEVAGGGGTRLRTFIRFVRLGTTT